MESKFLNRKFCLSAKQVSNISGNNECHEEKWSRVENKKATEAERGLSDIEYKGRAL